MKFIVDDNQIKAAAKFIAEYNKKIKLTAHAIESDIYGTIARVLLEPDGDKTISSATAGWKVFFHKDECYPNDHRIVEVLVDANVGGKFGRRMIAEEKIPY